MPTKSQRLIAEQTKDRERQSTRRARMKEARQPSTHTVRSAMAEALSYAIAKGAIYKALTPDVQAFLVEWGSAAHAILTDRKGYDAAAVEKAITDQIKPRKEHRSSTSKPSLCSAGASDDI